MSYVGKHEIWDVTLPGDKKGTVITLNVQNECATVLRMKKSAPEKNGPLFYVDKMVADAGKPSYIYTSEFIVFKRKLSGEEAAELGRVLAEAFGFAPANDGLEDLMELREDLRLLKEEKDALQSVCDDLRRQLLEMSAKTEEATRLSIQLDVYRGLYADLLEKVMEG